MRKGDRIIVVGSSWEPGYEGTVIGWLPDGHPDGRRVTVILDRTTTKRQYLPEDIQLISSVVDMLARLIP